MTALATLTLVHTLISLIGIVTGFVVITAMPGGRHRPVWAAWFLGTTLATSLTGYLFPVTRLMPSHIVGFLSLAMLVPATYGLYTRRLAGAWRKVYVIGSVIGLYFNTFVLVAQSFAKIPALKAMAPTQAEPPFAIAQGVVLLGFIVIGFLSVRGFREAELERNDWAVS